jgi:hypothetical protein
MLQFSSPCVLIGWCGHDAVPLYLGAKRSQTMAGLTNGIDLCQTTLRLMVEFLERTQTAPLQILAYLRVLLSYVRMIQSPQ